jgi:DNA polymerase III epsilon subunit-like protein
VSDDGRTLLDTLINPGRSIPWQASQIHGITHEMVRGKPSLSELMPRILNIVRGEVVVIYNAKFDVPFFPDRLSQASSIECAMIEFAKSLGGGRSRKLDFAAQHVGHRWTGAAHRALADAQACRSVWQWVDRGRGRGQASGPNRTTDSGNSNASSANSAIVRCPGCKQNLRVPAGQHIDVKCPVCKSPFRVRT